LAREGTGPATVVHLDDRRDSSDVRIGRVYGGGTGGGGTTVDLETKRYVDKSMDAVKAQNDAAFSKVLARLDSMHPATWQQNLGVVAAGVVALLGIIFAVLAFASDRFDSGVAAMGAIEEAIDAQREINASQDARLEKILGSLEAIGEGAEGE
jgi:hypothetical protein